MDKTITISENDLTTAEVSVLTRMTLEGPELILIGDILTEFSARLVKELFDEKEDK